MIGSSAFDKFIPTLIVQDLSDSESISSTPGTSEDPDDSNGAPPPASRLFSGGGNQPCDPQHLKSFLPDKHGAERLGVSVKGHDDLLTIPLGYSLARLCNIS